jgi:hypothetical protein
MSHYSTTVSRWRFDQNAADVQRLLEIHTDLTGDRPGRRYGIEVLNKSAIVLISAIWEAYCEDVVSEALDHLLQQLSPDKLPEDLKTQIAKELRKNPDDRAVWQLAGFGWKAFVKQRLPDLTRERNTRLNTAKTPQINELFQKGIGLSNVSSHWRWKKMSATDAATKLDGYITLRGEIAHRGKAAEKVKKTTVTDFFGHVNTLVEKTDEAVNEFVKTNSGRAIYENTVF